MLYDPLACDSIVKITTFPTLQLVHQVVGFIVSKGGNGIGQVGVRASE